MLDEDPATEAPPKKRWEIPKHGEFVDLAVVGKSRSPSFASWM